MPTARIMACSLPFFMAIRRPPDDYIPRVVRGGRVPPPRVVRYEEPAPGFFRRCSRFLLRPYVVIPTVLITALIIGTFGYYWVVFSARIDNLLKGEVYTRSAGISTLRRNRFAPAKIFRRRICSLISSARVMSNADNRAIARADATRSMEQRSKLIRARIQFWIMLALSFRYEFSLRAAKNQLPQFPIRATAPGLRKRSSSPN